MVTIILAICVPVTAFVTGYFALGGVRIGLQQSLPSVKNNHEPDTTIDSKKTEITLNEEEMDEKNPILPEEVQNILSEWLHGKEEEKR